MSSTLPRQGQAMSLSRCLRASAPLVLHPVAGRSLMSAQVPVAQSTPSTWRRATTHPGAGAARSDGSSSQDSGGLALADNTLYVVNINNRGHVVELDCHVRRVAVAAHDPGTELRQSVSGDCRRRRALWGVRLGGDGCVAGNGVLAGPGGALISSYVFGHTQFLLAV